MVVTVLVMLSIILTASVIFPTINGAQISNMLVVGALLAAATGVWLFVARPEDRNTSISDRSQRDAWRMPPLSRLEPMRLTTLNRVWLIVLRVYLLVAVGFVVFRVAQIILHKN